MSSFVGVVDASSASPFEVLEGIYTLPDPNFAAFYDPETRPGFYTRRIHDLALKKEACFAETFGMPHLDFDYIVPGQDYVLENLKIMLTDQQDDSAKALVRYDNGGVPVVLSYDLLAGESGWRIDNVWFEGTSLAKDLVGSCN